MNISPEDWRVVSKLFDDALDRSLAERERWLDSLPQEYAAYRETLGNLLATHAAIETDDFLLTVPKIQAGATTNAWSNPALRPGASLFARSRNWSRRHGHRMARTP